MPLTTYSEIIASTNILYINNSASMFSCNSRTSNTCVIDLSTVIINYSNRTYTTTLIQLTDHTLDCGYGSSQHLVINRKSQIAIAIHVFSLCWIIGTATIYLDHPKKWTQIYLLEFMDPSNTKSNLKYFTSLIKATNITQHREAKYFNWNNWFPFHTTCAFCFCAEGYSKTSNEFH